jgi:hypothetical protein
MLEKRKKIECRFEVSDMGCAGVRDQGKRVVLRESTSQGHPHGKGIKDIAEGLLLFLLCVGEIEVFGKKGEVLTAGMATSFVVVSAFV